MYVLKYEINLYARLSNLLIIDLSYLLDEFTNLLDEFTNLCRDNFDVRRGLGMISKQILTNPLLLDKVVNRSTNQ